MAEVYARLQERLHGKWLERGDWPCWLGLRLHWLRLPHLGWLRLHWLHLPRLGWLSLRRLCLRGLCPCLLHHSAYLSNTQ